MRSDSLKQMGVFLLLTIFILIIGIRPAIAGSAAEIDQQVDVALQMLHSKIPKAKELSEKAKGILVFPDVLKAGFIVGAQYGEGALRVGGKTVGYYNTVAASYGLQAGAQSFGYALIFLSDAALEYLKKSEGWEIGTGPSVVVVDEGMAGSLTTTSAKEDIYAFFFGHKGLMVGLGLQGTKITEITPDK
jgi:lipid-binding SYLF domain-containing protein